MTPVSGSPQSDKTRKLRAQFDKVRHTNIGRRIGVPVLLDVGGQDVGKSATITGITDVPFPSASGPCTRHAAEISSGWAPTLQIPLSVIPDPDSPEIPLRVKQVLAKYNGMQDLLQLPALQEDFQEALDLNKPNPLGSKFTMHILRIEVYGPTEPELTMVDLPGLMQGRRKNESDPDPELIRALARRYIRNPRAIVLAVLAADHDLQNQSVGALLQELKADNRTLAIITRPDRATEAEIRGLKEAASALDFGYGWHIVRNTSTDDPAHQNHQQMEKDFFSQTKWAGFRHDFLGTTALVTRLGSLLHEKLLADKPHLIAAAQEERDRLQQDLD